MQMLYNSDSYAVVRFDVPAASPDGEDTPRRGGYEIVDKAGQREIFIDGALAESFQRGVQALMASDPTEDALDEYLGRFAGLAHQPVRMH